MTAPTEPCKVTAKLTCELRERADEKVAATDDVPSLSYAVQALLELWVAGRVTLEAPRPVPADPERARRVEALGRAVREGDVSVYAAAKSAGVTYRTGRRWLEEWDALQAARVPA